MRSAPGILSILLALALVISNVALSGHLSSHNTTGSELCSLCVHAAGNDNALVNEFTTFPVTPSMDRPNLAYVSPCVRPIALHDKSSRAPPLVV